jgi:short-subunit dehydrogenase
MNILITGAGRGIGFELVKQFAGTGQHKIIAVSRNSEKLNRLKIFCNREFPDSEVVPFPYDLENILKPENIFFQELTLISDRIDILINNAGYLKKSDFETFDFYETQKMFNINFLAASELIRGLIPFLKKAGKSHVVNIGSMGGFQGSVKFPGLAYYSASKAALAVLTECLAEELKSFGIFVNMLALGAVQTEMLNEAFPGYIAQVNAEKSASFIADFAVNGNQFFNGKILPVSVSTP